MKKIITLILLSVLISGKASAQETEDIRLKCIHTFFEGYNHQHYEQMRNTLSGVLKLFFTPANVKLIYSAQYKIMGAARIDRIVKISEQGYYVYLKYERDTTETEKLGLSVSGKGKIIGLSDPPLTYRYPLTPKDTTLTEAQIIYKIDSLASLKHRVAHFNGCVMVIRNKIPVYQKSFGYADMDKRSPLDENTIFDLASVSKQFTAMGIMMLKQQGKLDYNQKVKTILTEFPYKHITIRQLLNHTSGLPDYMELFEKHWDTSKVAENKDVLELLKTHRPKTVFKAGKAYEYSNTGYVMLSLIIEKLSGSSYADFMEANIFQPLGMSHSRVFRKYSGREPAPNSATGYAYDDVARQYKPVTEIPELDFYRYLDGITGDGAINSCLSDLLLWDNALRNYRLVSRETFQEAIQPVQLKREISEYGFGWELQTNEKYQRLMHHSGSWGGNMNFILHFLDKDISVIMLSNNEYFNIGNFAYTAGYLLNQR